MELKIRKVLNAWILEVITKDEIFDLNGVDTGKYKDHVQETAYSFYDEKEEAAAFQTLLYDWNEQKHLEE